MSNKPITVEEAAKDYAYSVRKLMDNMEISFAECDFIAGAQWKGQQMQEERKKIIDAIEEALPYVIGAYECAFPDEDKNTYVARLLNTILTKYNSK